MTPDVRPPVTFTLVASPDDVREILALQEANLAASLSAEEVAREGFVTVRHDPAVLQRMNDASPSIIARAGGHVVGYALVMPRAFAPEVPVLAPMFALLDGLSWKGVPLGRNPRWFVMGQVCVARGHRGSGVFDGLYRTMAERYLGQSDFTVTEVAERNTRSMRAHARVGFETIHVYADETTGERWHVIALDLSRAALQPAATDSSSSPPSPHP